MPTRATAPPEKIFAINATGLRKAMSTEFQTFDATAVADRAGVLLSALCLLHCAATPLALLFVPTLGAALAQHGWVHPLLAAVLSVIAIAAFVPGYRRHRDKRIPWLAASGLALVIGAAAGAEAGLSDEGEIALTLLGGAALILAHGLNRSFCRRCQACRASTAKDCP